MRCKIAGIANPPSTSATVYISPQSSNASWATTETQFCCIPVSGFITNFRVRLTVAPGAGKSRTITLRVNSVDMLSVTVSDTNTTGVATGQVSVGAGDLINLSTTPSGVPAGAVTTWCMDFQGTNPQQSVILASSTTNATGLGYVPIMSNQSFGASAPANEVVISTPGTLSGLAIFLSAAVSTGSRTFTLRKNGVNQALAVSLGVGSQFGQDTVNSVVVAAGDKLVIQTGGSATAFTWVGIGMVFTPSTGDGYSSITCGCANSPSTTVANYQPISGATGGWNATETNEQHVMNVCTLKRLEVALGTAPGSGNLWQFNVKVNGNYVGIEVDILDTNKTGAIDVDVALLAGDVIALESLPTGGPTSSGRCEWALTTYQLNPATGRAFGVLMM